MTQLIKVSWACIIILLSVIPISCNNTYKTSMVLNSFDKLKEVHLNYRDYDTGLVTGKSKSIGKIYTVLNGDNTTWRVNPVRKPSVR